jgi:hypothetical protein
MSRSRASAKQAGTRFETAIAAYLADVLADDRIERRARNGAKDRGDLSGLRVIGGGRLVAELKDVTIMSLSGWVNEAHLEAGNDDAIASVVIHKRRGKADPGDQYVTCTLRDLVALMTGERPL